MKRKILTVAAAASLTMGLGATAAGAQGPPAGAGEGGQPAGIACQQSGIDTLRSLGLLSAVARDGIEVKDVGVLAFPTVLSLHRSDPELFQTGGVTVIVDGAQVPATWCNGL
jgi:2-polyprenyl-6-methoxyphenol hydroxylase-like FAD-dependent oxidoreductase